jgi:hypothetical protein
MTLAFLLAYLCIGIIQAAMVALPPRPDDTPQGYHLCGLAALLVVVALSWPVWVLFGRGGL